MTIIVDDPEDFVDDALTALCEVHPTLVRRLSGGVVRRDAIPEGRVAVVVGGGSGHHPAFAGLVGEGLASGAVCGNIFSSPSSGQAVEVIREVEAGAGVLLSYGNYAGDVLHFGEAVDRLAAEGIEVRTVLVTDDIASAPAAEQERRRGIAGDFVVFKIAGAAAERGQDLDAVERVARLANARTRTLGIAFDGCTLPGADEKLFRVPEGMMSIGLGIHGEPGIRDVPRADAAGIADILLGGLLEEIPEGADHRVVPLLNSLGTIGDEELLVLYGQVARRLTERGLTIVEPECGRIVTSLDMSGISLTLLWPDDELEGLWTDGAHTPAYRKRGPRRGASGGEGSSPPRPRVRRAPAAHDDRPAEKGSPASVERAHLAVAALTTMLDELTRSQERLGQLDAIAGDGDHGIGMTRGVGAALAAAQEHVESGLTGALLAAAEAWSDRAGGTSGALWAAILRAVGSTLDDDDIDATALASAARAAVDAVTQRGRAERGDKTMVDSMIPWSEALHERAAQGASAHEALDAAAQAAETAAEETSSLSPRLGRARPLAERSVGHPDPGAVSFALLAHTLARFAHDHLDTQEGSSS
jgi:D-erythrulose 4-kinase